MYFAGYELGHPIKKFFRFSDLELFLEKSERKMWWVEIQKTKQPALYDNYLSQIGEREMYDARIYPNLGFMVKGGKLWKI